MVAVGLSVADGRAVGTVVVDAFEVLVLAASCPPQAASEIATATDETYTRAANERNLSMRIRREPRSASGGSLQASEEGQIPEDQRTLRCCAPEHRRLFNPTRGPPSLPHSDPDSPARSDKNGHRGISPVDCDDTPTRV